MKNTFTAAISCIALLVACDTDVEPGDTTPPSVRVTDVANGNAVVYNSDLSQGPAAVTCSNGASPFGLPPGSLPSGTAYIAPQGATTTALIVSFSDPSGIQSARFNIPAADFDVISTGVTLVTNPQDNNQSYQWTFSDNAPFQSPAGFGPEVRPLNIPTRSPLTTLSFLATDGAGNSIPNGSERFFFFSTFEQACRL